MITLSNKRFRRENDPRVAQATCCLGPKDKRLSTCLFSPSCHSGTANPLTVPPKSLNGSRISAALN